MDVSDPPITNVRHVLIQPNLAIAVLDANVQDVRTGSPFRLPEAAMKQVGNVGQRHVTGKDSMDPHALTDVISPVNVVKAKDPTSVLVVEKTHI